jgi:hypothetical protein
MGRPNTAVFPPDWGATAGAVTAKTLDATVALRHPGTTQAWNPVTEQMDQVPNAAYYTGDCSVGPISSRAQTSIAVAGEDQLDVEGYQITLPRTVAPVEGDLATVTASGDTALDDHTLVVREVERASRRFSRVLFATLTD